MGIIYGDIGNHPEALSHLERSLQFFTHVGDQHNRAISFNNLGIVHTKRGAYQKALQMFEEVSAINREIGHPEGLVLNLINMSDILNIIGEYNRAIEVANEALTIAEELNYPLLNAVANGTLGNTHCYRGEYESAKACYLAGLEIVEQAGYRKETAEVHAGLAEIYFICGDQDLCHKHSKKATTIANEIGDKETLLRAPAYLSAIRVQKGQLEKGIGQLVEIGEKAKEHGDPQFILNAQRLLGQALLEHGRTDMERDEGRVILQKALTFARDKEIVYEVKWIGDILESSSNQPVQ
jgi:tetratricopeptide (TPR) repeat protein